MKKICKWCLLLVSICCLFACSDSAEDEAKTNSSYEKVKIAIILPKGQEGNGWDNVLGWVADNIRKANNMVEPDFEFYDENSIELELKGGGVNDFVENYASLQWMIFTIYPIKRYHNF